MAVTTTSTLANQYQTRYSKILLKQVAPLLALAPFGKKFTLPANSGALTIRMYRRQKANLTDPGSPAALAEGVAPTTYDNITFTPVDVALTQRGAVAKITDLVGGTALLDIMEQTKLVMAQRASLDFDTVIRNKLAHPTTGLTKRYAQDTANWAGLAAAAASAGRLTPRDLLDAMTTLQNNQATGIGGKEFVAIVPPAVARDILNNQEWREVVKMNDADKLYKGEIGSYFNIRIVVALNQFREDVAGAEGTYAANGAIHTCMVLGDEAFGVVDLSDKELSNNPNAPKVFINDKPDKTDPLNQYTVIGWKAMYGVEVLNAEFGIALRCKTEFVG